MRSRLPSISAVVHLLCYKGYRRHVTHLCASGKADLAKSLQEKTTTPTAGLLFSYHPISPTPSNIQSDTIKELSSRHKHK